MWNSDWLKVLSDWPPRTLYEHRLSRDHGIKKKERKKKDKMSHIAFPFERSPHSRSDSEASGRKHVFLLPPPPQRFRLVSNHPPTKFPLYHFRLT